MSSRPKLLEDESVKYTVHLESKEIVTHDTRRFRFSLPSKEQVLGLPIGQHIYLTATIQGQLVIRPYTPVSSDDEAVGYFGLIIKVYFANSAHPEGGKMSQYLESLSVGDEIQVRGPSGNLTYDGKGCFNIRDKPSSPFQSLSYKKVAMIAGGTGITPMYQFIQAVLKDPEDTTEIWLLFANKSEDDILVRPQLESLADKYPERLQLFLTVTQSRDSGWNHFIGHVNSDMIKACLPPPAEDTLVLLCGRPAMVTDTLHPALDQLGYSSVHRYKY